MKHLRLFIITVFFLAIATTTALSQSANIVEAATNDDRFTSLVQAVAAADLVETLERPGPFTVFAPTNEAFAALPAGTIDTLSNDKPRLIQVLLNHVVNGKVNSEANVAAYSIQGSKLSINIDEDGTLTVDGATVIGDPIEVSNGRIYVIDKVLIPQNKPHAQLMPVTGNSAETGSSSVSWLAAGFLLLLVIFGLAQKLGYLKFSRG